MAWGGDVDPVARLDADPYVAVHGLRDSTLDDADAVGPAPGGCRLVGRARWELADAARQGHTAIPTARLVTKLAARVGRGVDEVRNESGVGGRRAAWNRTESPPRTAVLGCLRTDLLGPSLALV